MMKGEPSGVGPTEEPAAAGMPTRTDAADGMEEIRIDAADGMLRAAGEVARS